MPLAINNQANPITISFNNCNRGRALTVGILSPGAYVLVLTALTFSPVSYVTPMRSISILIGVWMGTRLLGEADTRRRLVAASAMVTGVILLGLA